MRSYTRVMLLLMGLLVTAACSAPSGGKAEMKTHTSLAPGSKLTVVHYGAPW